MLRFWIDIGQPKDYILGLGLCLDSLRINLPKKLSFGTYIIGSVIVNETAQIGKGCLIMPDFAIGLECVIQAGEKLSHCIVMRGVRIKKHVCVSVRIICWHSVVGKWARVGNMNVLGGRMCMFVMRYIAMRV